MSRSFRARESAPPDFLTRLEQMAQRTYRAEQRARRVRWGVAGAALALVAAAALILPPSRPVVSPITAEELPKKSVTQLEHAAPRLTVARSEQVLMPQPRLPETKPRPSVLRREVAVLAEVRKALQAGEAKQALAVLDQHRAAFQVGQLGLEAEVLRLEALSQLGETKQASERARRFIDKNPNSPLVDRVRRYLTE